MILPQDIAPERSLYVMGARIIEILKGITHDSIDPKQVFDVYNRNYGEHNLSYNYFLYALDWLFLLNLIDINENTKLVKCY